MSEQDVEALVEIIMRTRYGKYEDYVNEEERAYWRKFLTKDVSKDDSMVREQSGSETSNL